MSQPTNKTPYGLLAEFPGPRQLISAAEELHKVGYSQVESYTPYPVEGLDEALHFQPWSVPLIFFLGGFLSAAAGFFMQYYASVVSYPENIGGRPLDSWPAFIPITFESGVLGGVLCGAFGMILLSRLPRYSHPLSEIKRFQQASSDAFFLCIPSSDPRFQQEIAAGHLRRVGAVSVTEVPK